MAKPRNHDDTNPDEPASSPRRAARSDDNAEQRRMLTWQQHVESSARTYPRRIPLALRAAQGVHVTDIAGRRYIDCLAGAGALTLGHNHPVIVDALRAALDSQIPWQTLDLMTPAKERFITELLGSLPVAFASRAKIQFCSPSGADAVEAAVKLVKTATGRRGLLCFRGGYHGMTHGALSLTGETGPKAAIPGLMPDVQILPFPDARRCPFGLGGEAGMRAGLKYIETLLDDPNSGLPPIAGMILEVVQGEGGVVPCPDDWLREIRRITERHGIALIIDEVQTGLGRTGTHYAFEQAGIVPDVVVLSKAIGGGLPLSVIVYREALDGWLPGAHAGTFRGNQLAMVAGSATIRFVQEHGLALRAAASGQRLRDGLSRVAERSDLIADVRGRGLMVGVEIQEPRSAMPLDGTAHETTMVARIQAGMLARGVITERGGRDGRVLRFLPPLIITEAQIDEVVAAFAAAVANAADRAS